MSVHKPRSTWVKNTGRGGGGTWLFQRLTGLFVAVILLSHFCINHFVGGGDVSYEVVRERLSSPMYKMLELGFLWFALWHGLAGVWVVVADYVKHHGWRVFLYGLMVLGGTLLGALGTYTIVAFPFK